MEVQGKITHSAPLELTALTVVRAPARRSRKGRRAPRKGKKATSRISVGRPPGGKSGVLLLGVAGGLNLLCHDPVLSSGKCPWN